MGGIQVSITITAAILYFLVGIAALCAFDLATKRVRGNLGPSVADTQAVMAGTGALVGRTAAIILLLAATWLLWPVVFAGAITDGKGGKRGTPE